MARYLDDRKHDGNRYQSRPNSCNVGRESVGEWITAWPGTLLWLQRQSEDVSAFADRGKQLIFFIFPACSTLSQ